MVAPNQDHMKKRIVIIGAGPGGLTSGMLLAHRGYDVTILEKGPTVGGRNAPLKAGPYTFDTGPTFLHQKFTLDEVFAETGRKPEDYLKFVQLDPMTRLTWGDVSMDTSSNEAKHDPQHRGGVSRRVEELSSLHARPRGKAPPHLPLSSKALSST